jgi:hypothetical protein
MAKTIAPAVGYGAMVMQGSTLVTLHKAQSKRETAHAGKMEPKRGPDHRHELALSWTVPCVV